MGDPQQDGAEEEDQDSGGPHEAAPQLRAPGRERLLLQKSSVCSRAYFVVVMVFFHVYILNVIALLLYVHYNNGPGDLGVSDGSAPEEDPSAGPGPPDQNLHMDQYRQSYSLPRIEGIRVGHVQRVSLMADQTHEMRTLSLKPLLFEVPGFLSEEECRVVVQLAQLKGLTESQTTASSGEEQQELGQPLLVLSTEEVFSLLDLDQDGLLQRQEIVSHSRSQDGTWLSPDNLRQLLSGLENRQAAGVSMHPTGALTLEAFRQVFNVFRLPSKQRGSTLQSHFQRRSKHTRLYQGPGSHHVLQTLRNRVTRLARLPSPLVELSEPLQVIRYENGGFSNAHHDSSPAHSETTCAHTRLAGNTSALTEIKCRYLTVMVYLNAVGGGGQTTFPVADNRTYDQEALVLQDGADLTDTRSTCGRGNLLVTPSSGTALLWYNHLSDGRGWMGEVDEFSLHGGCPVTRGEKWVATSWVNVDPDHQRQAQYQRLVADGPNARSGPEESYRPLSHSEFHQDL